jgi:hypothetical protein
MFNSHIHCVYYPFLLMCTSMLIMCTYILQTGYQHQRPHHQLDFVVRMLYLPSMTTFFDPCSLLFSMRVIQAISA